MLWHGHLTFTVRTGEAFPSIPAHMDSVIGAARPVPRVGHNVIDNIVTRWGGGGRVLGLYPSRSGLGRAGMQNTGFDDLEEGLGFSRTYRLQIAEPSRSAAVRDALRELQVVEKAVIQTLATAPAAPSLAPSAVGPMPNDAMNPYRRLRIPEAQAIEPGDPDLIVGVVDTGVSLGHQELQRQCLAGYSTVDLGLGPIGERLTLVGDSWGVGFHPQDQVGHGSMVAGIIGAHGWHQPRGVASRALLLPTRVLAAARSGPDSQRVGVGSISDINAGLKVAVDLGADVINMSFGTPESSISSGDGKPHERVLSYALHFRCVLVAAAGNKGDTERYYPAALPGVIAVGSVDEQNRRSRFSSWGDHISVCAPGEEIYGTARRGYRYNSGTSFSAPFVSGICALILSRARRSGLDLDSEGVRRVLTGSTKPLAGGFHPETGWGMADALGAMAAVDAMASSQHKGRRA